MYFIQCVTCKLFNTHVSHKVAGPIHVLLGAIGHYDQE